MTMSQRREDGGQRRPMAVGKRRELDMLIDELLVLRDTMLEFESRVVPGLEDMSASGMALLPTSSS